MRGSQSAVSNNVSVVSECLKCSRNNITLNDIVRFNPLDNVDAIKCSVIRDILNMRYHKRYDQDSFFNTDEIYVILEEMCTS